MSDPIGLKVAYLNANGQVATQASLVMATCTMHASGGTGVVEFHDTATTPAVDAVPKCRLDVVSQGVFSLQIPAPGALFEKGIYVKVPANSSINIFYKDANYG